MKRTVGGGVVVLALCVGACESASEHKAEAAAVSHAVNSLRDADIQQKRDFLGELRSAPCSTPDVCAVRSACLAAYELHVGVMNRVRESVKLPDAGAGDAAELEAMKRDLKRSLDLTAACTDAQGEMIRRYKL